MLQRQLTFLHPVVKDRREDVVQCLRRDDFSLEDFVHKMADEHSSGDAFALMRSELPAARRALRKGRPIHWKEVLDESQLENIMQHNGSPALRLGGIAIDGYYRLIGRDGRPNNQIYDIAFPHATGIRPYSYGLQACDASAAIVVEAWCEQTAKADQPSPDVEAVTRVYEGLAEGDQR